ncbi:MAG: PQQ-dependent sugar dehydrogenase [Flavobacterium sp.]|nr:PQQ-dependent sugar dehydrogenase [Flavobacterium sp.]
MKHLYTFILLLTTTLSFAQTIGIQQFATGFSDAVEIVNAGDERLFVVQQRGLIRIVNTDGTIKATPFLNLSSLVNQVDNEGGLLGLAFHPNYATNGFFYVNYTNNSGNTVIARYSVSSGNVDVASTTATILLTVTQPFSNHNGGTIKFGPDGYLYIGMGDGGSGGDPNGNGQNKNVLLGKMLRLDVDNGTPYGIPTDNPYVGITGSDEIWAIGLRNPWKFSFDNTDGKLWIADVGQENVEEINKVDAATAGLNFGWKCYEGNDVYTTSGCPAPGATYTFPYATYSSANGSGACSVTGGYVYRGTTYPNMVGKYFFADYCTNKIGMVNDAGTISYSAVFSNSYFVTFGIDVNNELYVSASGNGKIYKVVDTSLGIENLNKGSFALTPNPAKDIMTIKTTTVNFPLQMQVFDITGKRLMQQEIKADGENINISALQSGVYVVNIADNSGAVSYSKLIRE